MSARKVKPTAVDEALDRLLESNPALIEECRQIRTRMKQGEYLIHEQVLEIIATEGD